MRASSTVEQAETAIDPASRAAIKELRIINLLYFLSGLSPGPSAPPSAHEVNDEETTIPQDRSRPDSIGEID